ncbi:MAG: hypothetical protein K5840_06550 [Eubacterium sp.]|nr:hypothetical protein [Eubacterium sp.]
MKKSLLKISTLILSAALAAGGFTYINAAADTAGSDAAPVSESGFVEFEPKGEYSVSLKSAAATDETLFEDTSASASDSAYNSVNYDNLANTPMPSTRNQGDYGDCWAFGTMASLEFSRVSLGIEDSSVDYNELLLAWFDYTTATDPLGGTSGDEIVYNPYNSSKVNNIFSVGGNFFQAIALTTRWVGVCEESVYPYSNAATAIDSGIDGSYAYSYSSFHVDNAYVFSIAQDDFDDANIVKQMIVKYGAVATSMWANSLSSDEVRSTTYDETNNCYYYGVDGADHGIAIVGWDDDFSASNFNSSHRPKSDGAWLVRNSWSSTAGQSYESYFWVSYEEQSVGYVSDTMPLKYFYVFLGEEEGDEHDNNYQLDGTNVSDLSYKQTAANVFTTSDDANYQVLDKVGFMIEEAGSDYEVSVYKNVPEGGNPDSGFLACTVEGTQTYAGYVSVDLGTSIQLEPGERFSVIVKTDAEAGLDWEYGMSGTDSSGNTTYISTVSVEQNTSFYRDTGVWYPISARSGASGGGNFVIKAYTDDSASALSCSATSLKATLDSEEPATTVHLSWTAPTQTPDNGTYLLCRSSDSTSSGYETIATLSSSTTSYVDSSLSVGQTVTYVIRSSVTGRVASAAVTVTTQLAPTWFTVAANAQNGVKLSWRRASGAVSYTLQRYKGVGSWTTIANGITATSYIDKGVSSGYSGMYRVRANSSTSTGDWSSTVSVYRLAVPKIKTVKNTSEGIYVSWSKVMGANRYRIYRKQGKNGIWRLVGVSDMSDRSFTDESVSNGKGYHYSVQACYVNSGTWKTGYLSHTGKYCKCLDRPDISSVSRSGSSYSKAKVTWDKNGKVTGYQVRYTVGSKTYTVWAKGSSRVSKLIKHLKKGKTATIKVRAYRKVSGVKYYSAWSAKYRYRP